MPRAEVGSTKHISNKMKSKGLQRLRWYCQACSRQMRDENGFKCHVASESHVRQMMLIGQDPRRAINDYSEQFRSDFLKLLRTGHGEKKIHINRFYQEYIGNKEHVHMNATRWASLTEFAKVLGREGICRVEEEEADDSGRGGGLMISWIDDSPAALRRQDALRKKERQDRGDEEREWIGIRDQIAKARDQRQQGGEDIQRSDARDDDNDEHQRDRPSQRKEGEKIKLSFGATNTSNKNISDISALQKQQKPLSPSLTEPTTDPSSSGDDNKHNTQPSINSVSSPSRNTNTKPNTLSIPTTSTSTSTSISTSTPANKKRTNPLKSMTKATSKPINTPTTTATAATTAATTSISPTSSTSAAKPMSQAERIMRQEMEWSRQKQERGRQYQQSREKGMMGKDRGRDDGVGMKDGEVDGEGLGGGSISSNSSKRKRVG